MADSHDDPDRGDPGHRRTHDPELQKAREDTVQIFVQYARLSASAIERICPDQSSPTESESPSSSTRQCLQLVHDESSRNGAAAAGPSSSTLPRQKSSETATRKDPHPKAVYSTKQPAQIVSNPHCSVGESSTRPVSSGSTSTRSNRPDKLSLSERVLKRVPSATGSDNGSSGKTTPAQDPPLELMSPGTGGGELSSSYPPPSSSSSNAESDRNREWLIRSAEHATVAAASSSRASCTTTSERHFPSADKGADPRAVKARMIADRLKSIGDDLESEYGRTKLEDLATAISDMVLNSNLSWRRVAEIFKLLCKVMEARTRYDDQFSLFAKAWYCLIDSVVPWIQDRGGWAALQRETEPLGLVNTPNAPRRRSPRLLNPAQSEPVLLLDDHLTTSPLLCQPPYLLSNGGASSTLGRRVPEASGGGGRQMTYTPQMSRHHYGNHHHPHPHAPPPSREQSSPCLPRDRSNSQHSQHSQAESTTSGQGGRSRLWSLTESGSFKREEDGVEDIEHSISELNDEEEEGEESEAFVASQEGEGEEGDSQQEAKKMLTSISFHTSASFTNSSRSPPMIVPSPHSGSQPETISMDEFPVDSGIDASSLSLSGSPRGLHFTAPTLIETSFTSLSSVASASPVHTSPSSRKNSSNGGGYFSDKTRPRSGGSLKESSRQKHGGDGEGDSPQCYRTGSLRSSRSRPRYHQPMTTPTNRGTPSQSAASSGHGSSWMQTPVRRMSTSAAVIYEMVKDLFRSP